MSRKASAARPARSLLRTFCPCRLATTALAQAYEQLLPILRRSLPHPPLPHAPPGDTSRPRRRVASNS
jgi:hypothetical protein